MQYGITLICLGLLAAPSLLLSKKPDAQKYLDKIVPYQGWIGLVFVLWGIWTVIDCITHANYLGLGLWPLIIWISWLAIGIVELGLGFLLGYGMIQKYALSKNEAAAAKGEQLLKKLAPLQGTLGIAAIILGLWYTILVIMF